jgi:hypothetical protein
VPGTAAAVKAERKARAGLSRTIRVRVYPSTKQAAQINRTIGTIRFLWNTIWLPMLQTAQRARREHAERHNPTREAWREVWRLDPDPSETAYNRARIDAAKDRGRQWIGEAIQAPLTRAARNFALAAKSSRGWTQSGSPRKVRAGQVQLRSRRDDALQGLEWQLQGKALLGGVELARVIDLDAGIVRVPTIGAVRFRDKGVLLRFLPRCRCRSLRTDGQAGGEGLKRLRCRPWLAADG